MAWRVGLRDPSVRRMGYVCFVVTAALGLNACTNGKSVEGFNAPGVFESLVNATHPTPEKSKSKAGTGDFVGGGGEPGDNYRTYPGDGRVANTTRPPRYGVAAGGDGYTLNFNNAPLSELTNVILKDTLRVSYIYDPRVQGRVTLSTGRALSRDELLSALESVLQMNRGVLIKEGDRYRIAPIGEAKIGGVGDISYVEEARAVGTGYGVTVFPLRYVSSDTMLGMLRTFAAKPGALRADVLNNVLIIRGTGRERQSLIAIAKQFDVDWIKGQSVGIFPLKHAEPATMIAQLEKIFQIKGKGLGKSLVKIQPMLRLNAVLVITRRANLLRKVETWIRRLDRTNDTETRTFVYQVENAKAKYLAGVVSDIFSGQGTTRRSAAAEVTPSQPASEVSAGAGAGAGAGAQGGEASAPADIAATASVVSPSPSSFGSSGGIRIIADEANNKLIIRASARAYREILRVLKKLDRAAAQVLINATLAEVTLNDNLRYGVQVFLERNPNKFGSHGGFTNDGSLIIQPEFPGLNFLYGIQASPKVILDALSNETSVHIISSPSVVVVNNRPAMLQVGDEVPIATRQAVSVTDPAAPIVNNIDFRETGVILKVTPRINTDDVVSMIVEQEISSVVSSTATGASGTLTPTISKRKIASTISVKSGQMVVLGGLISERKQYFKNRVPIWEKVPVLGQFPGKTDNGSVRTELVVFLTPQVIHNSEDAGFIADELRDRLRKLEPSRYRKYERWPRKKWEAYISPEPNYETLKY